MEPQAAVQAVVDAQLDEFQRVYPKDRLGAIRRGMEAFWNRAPGADRIPRAVFGLGPKALPAVPEGADEDERELISQLQCIVEHAPWGDDYCPGLSPGIRQVTIPAYFGCGEEFSSASVRVRPAISAPEDVYALPALGFGDETPGGGLLRRMRRWRKMTRGILPLYEADLQGPFSVASQIWGVQEFLTALYDSPDAVHALLGRCTDAVIEYARLMAEAAEGDLIAFHCMPAIWYPREKGIAVSEDLLAVVSPRAVREFIRPYLERIAGAFGGVFVHTCGNLNPVMREINEVNGLVGVNFSSCETDIGEAMRIIDPRLFVVSHNSPVSCADLPVLTPVGHAEACARAFAGRHAAGVCVVVPALWALDAETHARPIADALDRRG